MKTRPSFMPPARSFAPYLLIWFLAAACDNAPGDNDGDALGEYLMESVNGEQVPTVLTGGNGEAVVAGGSLVLRAEGTFFLDIAIVINEVDFSIDTDGSYSSEEREYMLGELGTARYDGDKAITLEQTIGGGSYTFVFEKNLLFEEE